MSESIDEQEIVGETEHFDQTTKHPHGSHGVSASSACKVCEEATMCGNEAVNESFDNFQRFYFRPLTRAGIVPNWGPHTPHWVDPRGPSVEDPYRYTPLADEGHTRLLVVQPGKGDEPIQCGLQEMDIDDPPKYTALSYTWGAMDGRKSIEVDGHDFPVTNNLWHALWHIRPQDRPLTIWIDALCINQDDLDERNRVVRRMKDIYERSAHILAWLGPESKDGAVALLTVANIYEHFNKLVDKFGTTEAALKHMLDHGTWVGEAHDQAAEKQRWAINTLFNRTWFHRIWIVQEGTTPVPTTFQLCKFTVPLRAVYDVFQLLQLAPLNTLPRNMIKEGTYAKRMEALTTLASKRRQLSHDVSRKSKSSRFGKTAVKPDTPRLPLLDVLEIFRGHSASDPHDKVYATLGFAAEDSEAPVEIEYRKSLAKMLRDVAVFCVNQKEHKLRVLGHAGLLGSKHMPASWIPDWLFPGTFMPFPKEVSSSTVRGKKTLFDACAANHPIWEDKAYNHLEATIDGHKLKVPGIIVDYILTVSVISGTPENMDILETSWIVDGMDEIYEPTNELRETAYLRTLVADVDIKDGEVLGRGASMYWRGGAYKPQNHADVDLGMRRTCTYRRYITTLEHKYLGIGPYFVLQGDAIFMLKGGEMLYLARPTMDGTYHFVGEVYIHGMMDGAVVEKFNRGQGTLQMVEFAPVRNVVPDSSKPDQTSLFDGIPYTYTSENVTPNLRIDTLKNPNDDADVFVHTDVGPRIDGILEEILTATVSTYMRQGLSMPDAVKHTVLDEEWADAAEHTLLTEYPIEEGGSSSRCGLAGRDYARRSYIRAAIAQQKVRFASVVLGDMQNILPNGEVLALSVKCTRDEEGNGKKRQGGEEPCVDAQQQLTDDELLARKLQEEEYTTATMPTTLPEPPQQQHPQTLHPQPQLTDDELLALKLQEEEYTTNTIPTTQSNPPQEPQTPQLQPTLYPPSLTATYPLLYPRCGPPVRLQQRATHNPRTWKFEFQQPSDAEEFFEDVKAYTAQHGGGPPPVLFGKWATDPKKRPNVVLTGFGDEGDLWWEDEEGNVVPGPEEEG